MADPEKWYDLNLPFVTLISEIDSCNFLGRKKPELNLQ
jgi:hypothetical protein